MKWLVPALCAAPVAADPAQVVTAHPVPDGWRFEVTLTHADTGGDDYADGWRIELPDGTVLGTRALLHPHVEEQPFTRSLSGVAVPEGTREPVVRARTGIEGWATSSHAVPLD